MGKYSSETSSDEDRRRRQKKKKKKRSDSSSSVESYRSGRHHKSKKSKKTSKHKRRSRDRSSSRGRSRGGDHASRSYSTERRRSTSKTRRTQRSRSRSRRDHRRSRSHSVSSRSNHRWARSRSGSVTSRSRRRSPSVESGSDSKRGSTSKSLKKDAISTISGLDSMTPAEKAQAQMKLALKAAAAADVQLKEQGVLPGSTVWDHGTAKMVDTIERSKAIDAIENDSFVPAAFSSSRHKPLPTSRQNTEASHENAIFGLGGCPTPTDKPVVCMEIDTIMHPNLFVNADTKMKIWIEKLTAMRQKKLDGNLMRWESCL